MIRAVPSTEQHGIPSRVVYEMLGISKPTLSYWIRTGVIRPSKMGKRGKTSGGEYNCSVFSYEVLLELKSIVSLIDAGMPLQRVRKVLKYIRLKGYKLQDGEWVTDGNVFYMKDIEDDRVIDIMNPNQFTIFNWGAIRNWVNGLTNSDW